MVKTMLIRFLHKQKFTKLWPCFSKIINRAFYLRL